MISASLGSAERTRAVFEAIQMGTDILSAGDNSVCSPIDGEEIAAIAYDSAEVIEEKIAAAHAAFETWRLTLAPRRGELVRQFGLLSRPSHSTLVQTIQQL